MPKGFNRDLSPAETGPDVWNEAQNVIFNDGFATNPPGWTQTPGTLIGQPLWLLPVYTPTTYWWVYGGNNDAGTAGFLAVTDGTNHFDITPVGGLQVTGVGDWTGGVLNGIPVINNGIDVPMWWDLVTINPAQPLPDWPANTTCKALRPFKFHLIAMNITQNSVHFGDWVLHSDAADPGAVPQSWTPLPENQAGSFSVATVTGEILDGQELRDLFLIYKQASNAIVQYAGGRFIFQTRRAFVETGALSTNCARELFGQHYMITDGDIVRHNGQEVVSLIDGRLREWLFKQIDSNSRAAHVAISHADKQVWFNFPRVGDEYCSLSLVWDLTSQSMGVVEYAPFAYMARGILGDLGLDNTFDAAATTFDGAVGIFDRQQFNPTADQLVFCRYTEKELNYLEGSLRGGAGSQCVLQMLTKDFGHPNRYKTIDRIWVNGEAGPQSLGQRLQMRIGSQEFAQDDIKWSPQLSLYRDKSVNYAVSGRFISIELVINQLTDWRLNSLDVDFLLAGEH